MIRARNLIDGLVIPHKDFVELDKSLKYFRVFLPIELNLDSYHSDKGGVFQMQPGEIWYLNAGIDHAAANFSTKSRMFLCFDFVFSHEFLPLDIFKKGGNQITAEPVKYLKRKEMSKATIDAIIECASKMIEKENFKDFLFLFSKYHFFYDVEVGTCYDWLVAAIKKKGDSLLLNKAQTLQKYLLIDRSLGERFFINEW